MKKHKETEWLKEVNSQSLQASLVNLDQAYTKFFREKVGFPKFKSKHNIRSWRQTVVSVIETRSLVGLPRGMSRLKNSINLFRFSRNLYFNLSSLMKTNMSKQI
jgi:transposase